MRLLPRYLLAALLFALTAAPAHAKRTADDEATGGGEAAEGETEDDDKPKWDVSNPPGPRFEASRP